MKRNLTVSSRILVGLTFLLAVFIGVGISSPSLLARILPFAGIMAFVIFGLSGKSGCCSKRIR